MSYRAVRLTANFGALGELKSEVLNLFRKGVGETKSLKLDLAIGEKHFLKGKNGTSFLNHPGSSFSHSVEVR